MDECNVTDVSETSVSCRPSASQPPSLSGQPISGIVEVVVVVGFRNYSVGYLSYEDQQSFLAIWQKELFIGIVILLNCDNLPINTIAGVAAVTVLLLLILAAMYGCRVWGRRDSNNRKFLKEKGSHGEVTKRLLHDYVSEPQMSNGN